MKEVFPKINEGGRKSNKNKKNFNNKVYQGKKKKSIIQVINQIGENKHGKSQSMKYQKSQKDQFNKNESETNRP
jgi:hypothetical protein